jgi:hypothetical protein
MRPDLPAGHYVIAGTTISHDDGCLLRCFRRSPFVTHFTYLGHGNPEFTRAAQAWQSHEQSSGVQKAYSLQGNKANLPSPSSVDRFHPCGTEARTIQQLARQAVKVIQ